VSNTHRPDPWTELRVHTDARIALGRSGASLPTAEVLRFGVAHAQARDAVHLPFDVAAVRDELTARGFDTLEVESAAVERTTYLHRPDLGRVLSAFSRELLRASASARSDVLCVIGDGLSSRAVHRHAVPLLLELRPRLESTGLQMGPVVAARQARVALGDEIGQLLHGAMVLMLIGERPGLSSPDSLGAYLTWAPRIGCNDSERNCVSNIRPEGLTYGQAARKIAWLAVAARQLGGSGVRLKDEAETDLPPAAGSKRDTVIAMPRHAGSVVSSKPDGPERHRRRDR
jgi:ethanolamine ammonia-lyase small subunit